jgi:hypothetical protein
MLANTLSLDDEEAVQSELAELQREYMPELPSELKDPRQELADRESSLPDVPSQKPISSEPEGEWFSFLIVDRLAHQSCDQLQGTGSGFQ